MLRFGKDNIPEHVYDELIHLFGEKRTARIMRRTGCNYHFIIYVIANEKFKRKFKFPLFLVLITLLALLILFFHYTNNLVY